MRDTPEKKTYAQSRLFSRPQPTTGTAARMAAAASGSSKGHSSSPSTDAHIKSEPGEPSPAGSVGASKRSADAAELGPRKVAKRGISDGAAASGPEKMMDFVDQKIKEVQKPKKFLFSPVMMQSPPAPHPERVTYLNVIRDNLKTSGNSKPSVTAVKLELETAKKSTLSTYKMNIRNLVRQIKSGYYKDGAAEERASSKSRTTKTVLKEELVDLMLPISTLEKRYIMEIPSDPIPLDMNFRTACDRCKQVYSISDVDPVVCTFHPARRLYDPDIKRLSPTYPCCGQIMGETNGCTTQSTHVFKLNEPSQLAGVRQFVKVPPSKLLGDKLFAAGIDCEMGYTSKGMELIRLTVVNWDDNKIVLDRVVLPEGMILDLNTRFSGVANIEDGTTLDGTFYPTITFEQARKELFKLIDSKTILIGHGLENDVNTLRLVHDRIVDTALLYPRHRTRTYALKQLAWTYLSRRIQSGEHDSYEDALAAVDIVKADIKQRLHL